MIELKELINKTMIFSTKAFINRNNELIIFPKVNLYFRLEDVKNELDFKCKVLEWCSKMATNIQYQRYYAKETQKYINYILNTAFTPRQFEIIYCRLGNCVHHQLTIDFINSNYDFELLIIPHCKECLGQCLLDSEVK